MGNVKGDGKVTIVTVNYTQKDTIGKVSARGSGSFITGMANQNVKDIIKMETKTDYSNSTMQKANSILIAQAPIKMEKKSALRFQSSDIQIITRETIQLFIALSRHLL